MRPHLLLLALFVTCGIVCAQNLANSGWPKNHADLHNSGVHTFANGLRSFDNAQMYKLDPAVYGYKGEGSVAFTPDGTAYISLTESLNGTRLIRVLPDLSVEHLAGDESLDYWSGTAITDDDKVILVAETDFTIYDIKTNTNVSYFLGSTDWYLYGPSATVVDGAFYIIDGNANLVGYYLNGTMIGNFSTPLTEDSGARNEFNTPATTGNGIFYYCTASTSITNIYAVRMPQAQLVWKFNATTNLFGVDPITQPEYLDVYPNECDTSSVISPDGKVVYQMLNAGIIALNADTGSLKWAKSFTSLADGVPLVSDDRALVSPVINPIDGSVIVLVINDTVSGPSNESYVWGLSQNDGSVLHSAQLSVPSDIQSAPAVTADGVFYFCTLISCHAVDVKSNPWKSLWSIENSSLSVDYSALAISPDGSIWFLDDSSEATWYVGCDSGHYIDSNGICSPCPANTTAFGTSCGFQCGNTVKLYHKNASCDCGAGKTWDYATVSCIDTPITSDTPTPTEDDESGAERIASGMMMLVIAAIVLVI